jgi:membrane-associated phospholipid phosphatase
MAQKSVPLSSDLNWDQKASTTISKSLTLKIVIIVLAIWALIELTIRETLYEYSATITLHIRANHASKNADLVFRVISELADKNCVAVGMVFAQTFMDQPKAVVMALISTTCLMFNTILKTLYHESRPFFTHDFIPGACPLEYGNPSGHSMISSSVYLTLCEMFCRHMGWVGNQGFIPRLLLYTFSVLMILVVSFSRIFLGVHSID